MNILNFHVRGLTKKRTFAKLWLALYFKKTMNTYSLLFILSGNLAESEVPAILENVKSLLAGVGAERIAFVNRGKQRLAYPLGQLYFGHLINTNLFLPPERVSELKEKLKLELDVVRFMLTEELPAIKTAASYTGRRDVVAPAVPGITRPVGEVRPKADVDLKTLDKRIDEILQRENITI